MLSVPSTLRALLLANLQRNIDATPLSLEMIVTLISQHLKCKRSRRLPALIIAAVFEAVKEEFREESLSLKLYHAGDQRTRGLAEIEIWLANRRYGLVCEMKIGRLTRNDVDKALSKIAQSDWQIDNYLFVTTDAIDDDVREYAANLYEETGGTEVAILDCVGFLRHFLHLFHRSRTDFLNAYQELVLTEPDSAVSAAVKEAFLALRQAAESGE